MLASYDDAAGFGGLLFTLKNSKLLSNNVIDFFENKLSNGMIKTTTNVQGLTNAYKVGEKSVVKYISGLKDGSIQLKNGQTMLQGYQAYLNSTTKATTMAELKTKALSSAMKVLSSIGWMLAITTTIKVLQSAWDTANTTVAEVQERVDDLSDSISTLESEYASLKETGSENLTEAELSRLDYLENRIEYEKELKDLEEARLIREKYGTGFTDYFDKDSQISKDAAFRKKYFNGQSALDVVAIGVGIDTNNQAVINMASKVDEYNKTSEDIKRSTAEMAQYAQTDPKYYQAKDLNARSQEKLTSLVNDLKLEYQNYKSVKYEAELAISEMEEDLKNPLLTEKDKENIKADIAFQENYVKIADYYIDKMKNIPGIPLDTDTDTYHNWYKGLSEEEKEVAESDEFKNALEEQKKSLGEATLGAENYAKALQQVGENQGIASGNKTSILFTDTISQVQSLSNGLDQLDKIYADVLDKESFDWSSVLNNKEFIETFGGLGAVYDDFIKTISNSPNDINACQSAFNELTTAYIQNGDALSGLTEETKQVSIAMLEEMGIKNAEEVVTSVLAQKVDELAAKKILAANSTYTLSNLTVEEINSLLAEGVIAEQTAQRLAIFALQKQLSNNYRIETQEDVNRIYSLAQMAGIGAEALAKFAQFKNNLENETDPRTRSYIIKSINEYKSTLFSEIEGVKNSKIEIPEVSYGGGSATKNAIDQSNKAAEDNKAKFKEILDKYLELYKAELDAGLIDFETFLNKSRSLLDEYYRDGKISGKEYWDYIGNLQKEQLSVYDKVLSAVTKRYDDEIDKINDIIDGLEKQNDALNDQLDQYDNVLGVVDKVYESEIDRIQEQQDAIDETISKLQDENDEKQRAIELEKARYQLYRALNNRTVKLYNGKEYIYTHNRDEVRDAQQNLADLELEETVAGLEKEKEALDDVIEELEKYREMWQEISSAKEDEEYKQLAIAIWGKDYEKIILSNRITDIEAFKDKYIHLQQQIEDNQGLIDSYNEKIEYYEALKEAWNAVATEREEAINREIAAQVLGANWENDILNGRMDVLNNFKNMYIATQQAIVDAAWNAANAQIAALNAVKAAESTKSPTSGGSSGSVSSSASNKPNKPNKKPSHSNSGGGNSNRPSMEKYGTGTNNAKPGTHIVAENGKEIIRTNDGEMLLAEHKQPFKFAGGETVISNSETTELLNNLGNYKPVEFVELTGTDGNKFKIRPEDIMKRWERNLTTLFPLPPNYINTTAYDNAPVRNNNTTSINIGDIHLHEVQNVDGLAKAIIRELPGKVAQAMYRK